MRVMIVDDEPNVLRGLSKLILSAYPDFEIVCFSDAIAALAYGREHELDVIITDVKMPRINGLKLCRQLGDVTEARIIVISGYDNFSYAVQALEIGVVCYILKPINQNEMLAAFDKAVTLRAKEIRERAESSHVANILVRDRLCALASGVETTLEHWPALPVIGTYTVGLLDISRVINEAISEWIPKVRKLERQLSGYLEMLQFERTQIRYLSQYQIGRYIFLVTGEDALDSQFWDGLLDMLQSKFTTALVLAFGSAHSAVEELPIAVGEALLAMQRELSISGNKSRFISTGKTEGMVDPLLARLDALFEENSANISLQFVADKLGFHPTYLSVLFKSKTGLKFKDYILKRKLEIACRLLTQTQLQISEIAASLGYQGAEYFARVFKKNIGQSPTSFRAGLFFKKEEN